MGAGGGAHPALHRGPGNSRKVSEAGREATRKDYGVLVAMPLGHSRVPPRLAINE
jgi:hypothetical protein